MSEVGPTTAQPDELEVGGESFDVSVLEEPDALHIYYDAQFEDMATSHEAKLNILEAVANRYDTDGKSVHYYAD